MDNEFTAAEIEEAIMAARLFSQGYGQKEFQACSELERRLGDSGYLGVVCGLARFEKEKGVACTEVLDACEQLLEENAELEQKVANNRVKLEMVETEASQAQNKLHQLEEATKQAKAELEREEKELAALRKRAEKEKQRIDEELECCRQEANVTREEIVTAGRLKAEVEKHGFSLDLALGLSREFAGYENIKDEVAKALKEGQTLTNYNKQAEGLKETLQGNRRQLEGIVSQLRADEAFEKEIRGFYHRYRAVSPLMEHLTTWRSIYLVRCNNPLFADRFWTERTPLKRCPCCNYPDVVYDEKLYQALNQPVGTPLQLKLGE